MEHCGKELISESVVDGITVREYQPIMTKEERERRDTYIVGRILQIAENFKKAKE